MQPVHRASLLAGVWLALLCGCNFDSGNSAGLTGVVSTTGTGTGGTGTTGTTGLTGGGGGLTGTADAVIATASVAGTVSVEIGSTQTISVTFTSGDERAIRGLAISGTTLPAGWSGTQGYSCTLVGAGSSCVVNLTYAPQAADSGTLSLNYIYIDNANEPKTPGGTLLIPYVATVHNNVVAALSPTGLISAAIGGGTQSVSVNFTTDDGNAASGLTLITDLSMLPSGWSSAAPSFSCAIVSTGSGCQLVLNYTPTAAASGTLTLSYVYTDDAGGADTGTLSLAYSTTTNGNIVALVAPSGQIEAIQKTGSQPVTVTFVTADGKPATGLTVLSDLTKLPAGWSSGAGKFSCKQLSSGNGCQLALLYAPVALARGTLTFDYGYFDAAGTYTVGSTDIGYAATTNDNVVATAAPSGQINAIVGMGSQPVSVTFTTDDGRPATALQVTSDLGALPAGWASTSGTFACSGVNGGSGCQLSLAYQPAAADSGTLTVKYSYLNNAGEPKSGSLDIPYRATTDNNVVATPSQNPLAVTVGSNNAITVTFATDDGNPASAMTITSGLSPLPAGWSSAASSFTCASVSVGTGCQLSLSYAPVATDAGTLTLGFSYTNNSGMQKSGTLAIGYSAGP